LPLYEYACKKCGRTVEKIQRFSDAPLKTCESCQGELKRLISAPAIQFKGTGWYVTDYAHKSSADGGSSIASYPAPEKAEKKEKEPAKAPEPAKACASKG
jgi:putative FmdB family regulatory protein